MGDAVRAMIGYPPTFNGDRSAWHNWRKQVISSMGHAKMCEIMTGEVPSPVEGSLTAIADWNERNVEIYHRLVRSLEGPALDLLADDPVVSGVALWSSFVRHFEGHESLRKAELRQRLYALTLEPREDAGDFLTRLDVCAGALRGRSQRV